MIGKPIFLNKIKKTGRDFQRQTRKTDIQESKELVQKVSTRKHNNCRLIIPTDVLYSDVENFEGGKLNYYHEH